jgi:hypothetical protein
MVRSFLASLVRRFLAFALAMAIMVILGSAAHSLFVQQAWITAAAQSVAASGSEQFAATIAAGERIDWVLHDLVGLQPLYGALVAIALLLGLLIAGAVARITGGRLAVFAIAGASCIFAMFTILKLTLGTVGVFGARGAAGLGVQMVVGLLAALLFAAVTRNGKVARA